MLIFFAFSTAFARSAQPLETEPPPSEEGATEAELSPAAFPGRFSLLMATNGRGDDARVGLDQLRPAIDQCVGDAELTIEGTFNLAAVAASMSQLTFTARHGSSEFRLSGEMSGCIRRLMEEAHFSAVPGVEARVTFVYVHEAATPTSPPVARETGPYVIEVTVTPRSAFPPP